ncbi:alpha/beta hydrolase [Bradyrhizobium ontarionense]|uniref:Alpha/beta hydrolase n=1 Tax=Bradyrhizobium ontarionense TaxID=2898149 RepID=A0ABY3RG20_9BRAD|nr:alpha/beta hydrolase [Bradyrhizobium sp. A19]UFZ06399.1 alpha/beta hydrolase [Bradyrhizobium sp. A19]
MILRVCLALMLSAPAMGAAFADETVTVGGSRAALIRPAAVRASVILLPGGDGAINVGDHGDIHGLLGNQLVRTRNAYAARGLAVLVADYGTDLKAAVDYMAAIKRPVTVIATSRGTLRAAEGIARGARPDALVLTSGFLSQESGSSSNAMSILGSPSALPRTLVIHHTADACRFTLPAGVAPFIRWSGGKARVKWLSGGAEQGDACEARGHHGFNGLDGQVVGLAAGFR